MNTLDGKELLFGKPDRLRNVLRFGTCRRHVPESVAEHCFFVSFYCLVLGSQARALGEEVDMARLLSRALVHDLEEAVTGDFPRPYKYSDPNLKMHLDVASAAAFEKLVDGLWPEGGKAATTFRQCWEEAKDGSLEGQILDFADYLSALNYIYREWRSGNVTIREHLDSLPLYRRRFNGSWLAKKFPEVFKVADAALSEVLEEEIVK